MNHKLMDARRASTKKDLVVLILLTVLADSWSMSRINGELEMATNSLYMTAESMLTYATALCCKNAPTS